MPSHVYWYTTNTFLGNKSCLHHLSEVLPQYPRVSLKLWHFHSAQLEKSKKCYFSRTEKLRSDISQGLKKLRSVISQGLMLEGEKRREEVMTVYLGGVLDPPLMACLRQSYPPISPNLNFTSP